MKIPKGWSENEGKLCAVFKCKDFKHALALLHSIGDIAEKLQHHPDLGVRNYNEVLVSTITHDQNKITEKDYHLAQEINDLLNYEATKKHIEENGR